MANSRIKDLPDIEGTLDEDTIVPGDSTPTGTGGARISRWVRGGIVWALANASTALDFGGRAVSNIATLATTGAATVGGTLGVTGLLTASNGAAMNAKRITGVLDPASAQDAATKAYVDAGDSAAASALAGAVIAAEFSDTGAKLWSSSALFTGNATVSDTSLYSIPFAGTAGTYTAVAVVQGTNKPNFCSVGYTGAPTAIQVRTWKYDGTKEAQEFSVVIKRS